MIAWYKALEIFLVFAVTCIIWVLEREKEGKKTFKAKQTGASLTSDVKRCSSYKKIKQDPDCEVNGKNERVVDLNEYQYFNDDTAGSKHSDDPDVWHSADDEEMTNRQIFNFENYNTSEIKQDTGSLGKMLDSGNEMEANTFREIKLNKIFDVGISYYKQWRLKKKSFSGRKPSKSSLSPRKFNRNSSQLEVRTFQDDSVVEYVKKTCSVGRAVSVLVDRLNIPCHQILDLFWNEGLLSSSRSLKDCCGVNWLYLIRRPKHRTAPHQYYTDAKDMIDPFEDEESRVAMSCGHAITLAWEQSLLSSVKGFRMVYILYHCVSSIPDIATLDWCSGDQYYPPSNLYDYSWTKIRDGALEITCPAVPNEKQPGRQCGRIWDFHEYSTKAGLSDDEKCLFQVVLFNNWRGRNKNVNKCPDCGIHIQSTCNLNGYFKCSLCDKEYCVRCYRPWTHSSLKCEDEECVASRKRLQQQLDTKTCGVKTIIGVTGCPKVRACPQCQTIIQHDGDACKHMDCPYKMCRIQFCFICLAVKKDKYYWPDSCHGAFYACKLAPVQTIM